MLEMMYIILAEVNNLICWQHKHVLYRFIKSINLLCALSKLLTQNRYSPMIAVYSTFVVHYRDSIICAHYMFEKQGYELI